VLIFTVSAVLVYLGKDLDNRLMNNQEKEAITSLCSGGAFFGAIAAGVYADRFGRKTGIYIGCLLFTIGALIQAASYSFAQMCVGRFVVGLGVGSAAMIAPLYIAEIAPTKYRGRMIGLNNMSITGGQVLSYGLGAGFAYVPHGWRYMVGLGGVPSIVLACLLPFCPESPRQLIVKGREDEAAVVFHRVFHKATPEQVQNKIKLIKMSMAEAENAVEGKTRWQIIKELHTNPRHFRALVVACGLMVISQMSGFNTLMYYSSTLFALVGFSNPTAVGLVVAGTNFVMTFVNAMFADPWGRRKILVYTAWGMSAGLLSVAVAFHWIPVNTSTLELEQKAVSTAAIVVLVFIIFFVITYGVSVGNTAWMSTDFFSQEVRAMGTMFLTCSCWGSNGKFLLIASMNILLIQSSHRVLHFPHSDAFAHSIRHFRLLCRHLLRRMGAHCLLLPRGLRTHHRRDITGLRELHVQDGLVCAQEATGTQGCRRARQDYRQHRRRPLDVLGSWARSLRSSTGDWKSVEEARRSD
jgi:SP family myo-inositol transporter-like MFS transporter 13